MSDIVLALTILSLLAVAWVARDFRAAQERRDIVQRAGPNGRFQSVTRAQAGFAPYSFRNYVRDRAEGIRWVLGSLAAT